jgi:hypothetical protein
LRQWRYRLVAASGVDEEGDDETVWATFISLWLHLFYSATPRYGISLDCSRRILSHRFLVSFDKLVEIVILFHIISLVNVKWLRPCWCCVVVIYNFQEALTKCHLFLIAALISQHLS